MQNNCKAYNDAIELAESFQMSWGSFQGKTLAEIPDRYIRWLAENCDDVIAAKADIVMRWRDRTGVTVEDD